MNKRTMKVQVTVSDTAWNILFLDSFAIGVEPTLSQQKVKEIVKQLFKVCLRYNRNARKTDNKKSTKPSEHNA